MTRPHRTSPPFWGSLVFLLSNLPLGILAFTVLVTLFAVGLGTAVIWVGVPVLACVVLLVRGAGRVERARLYALLDRHVAVPYRPLPATGTRQRCTARVREGATWRDFGYLLLLLPAGIVEFTLVVVFWSVSLGLVGLPIYYRFLPEGAFYFPAWDLRWFTVDSVLDALPWTALGLVFAAVSLGLTRALAAAHGRCAVALLRPRDARRTESAQAELVAG